MRKNFLKNYSLIQKKKRGKIFLKELLVLLEMKKALYIKDIVSLEIFKIHLANLFNILKYNEPIKGKGGVALVGHA